MLKGMAQMTKTILVKEVVDEKLIDSTKTIYNIVSNIYPKNESDVFITYFYSFHNN